MPLGRTLLFLVSLISLNSSATAADDSSSASPTGRAQALAYYRAGMELLGRVSPSKEQLAYVEQVFERAAAGKLPQAHYGLACAIYRGGDETRYKDAFAQAREAAKDGIVEAEVLLAKYHWNGIGTSKSAEFAHRRI